MGVEGLRRRWSGVSLAWRINSIVIVMAILFIVAIRVGVEPASSGDGEGCAAAEDDTPADVEEPVGLTPRDGFLVGFRWVFDASDTVEQDKTILDWQLPAQRPESVEIGDRLDVTFATDLRNGDDSKSIPEDQVSARAVVTPNGVQLSVCVDTSGASPDRYTSTVSFVDRDIKAAPFAVDVTVKHREEWIPLSAIVAGLALSLIVLVLSVSEDDAVKPARIVGLAIAALLVAAGTARPWSAWQDDPTWGKSRFDALTLMAATGLAFTGAMVASTTIPGLRKAAQGASASEGDGEDGDGDGEHDGDGDEQEETGGSG